VGAGIRAGGPKDRQGAEFIALLQAHGIHVRLGDTLGTSPCRASCGSHMIAFPALTDSLFYISPRLYREAVTSHSEGVGGGGGGVGRRRRTTLVPRPQRGSANPHGVVPFQEECRGAGATLSGWNCGWPSFPG
jgi:hypothetical protein